MVRSSQINENYESVTILLEWIKFKNHNRDVCGGFKLTAFSLSLQGEYTKHSCFLNVWNSRADEPHYLRKDWLVRQELTSSLHNVKISPLVRQDKILQRLLHIKLALEKQFVKALKPESKVFQYI